MTGPVDLDRGLDAVGRRDWARARSVLGAHPVATLPADALEGLALACWWLDDGPGFVRAREALFRRHQTAGHALAAGRVALRLSWDVEIVGQEPALARAWLDRSVTLLTRAGATRPDRLLCELREASLTLADGPHAALAAARDVCAEARRLGSYDVEALALVHEGDALLALGDVRGGIRALEEATLIVCSGDATDPLPVTLASCRLLAACSDVRDYERAAAWLPRIVEHSAGSERGTMAVIGRCTTVPLLLGRGLLDDADGVIADGLLHFGSGNASWERSLHLSLAELRFRQGRLAEVETLLDRAEPDRRCRLIRASMALAIGDGDAACEHASAFLRQSSRRALDRVQAYELLVVGEASRGRLEAARLAHAELADLAGRAGTPALAAAVRRSAGAIAIGAGDPSAALAALQDAVDLYERAGAADESTATRLELARVLEAGGRPAEAASHRAAAAARDSGGATSEHRGCPLSARELEVLALIASGRSNARIADELVVSPHTVHRHVANILGRLDCRTRASAVAVATARGWLATAPRPVTDRPLAGRR